MDEATLALTAMTGLILVTFLGFLIWAIRTGQFKNIEDTKYQLFRNSSESNDSEDGPATRGGDRK